MIDFHSQLAIIPTVYESAVLQDNLEHSGGVTISWKSKESTEIPLGSYVTYNNVRYVLLEPYAPVRQDKIHCKYDVTFRHPQGLLDRTPFWIRTKDSSGTDIDLRTTSFTGYPVTIAEKLCDFFSEYVSTTNDTFFRDTIGTNWKYDIRFTVDQSGRVLESSHTIITVAFDSCSIKSAATAIADAMGCNVFFDWSTKTIRFIAGTTISGESYNCFHVLGGTRNMGKRTVSGSFAAVTQRLTLKDTYPGSMMRTDATNGIMLTKDLIFDDIYPKQELYISYAFERVCYCTDEKGDYIVDPSDSTGYKTFAKWYVRLSYDKAGTRPYTFNRSELIDDQPLSLLFQIDYNNTTNMSALVGRQFELTYFSEATDEWDKTDVVPWANRHVTSGNEFRIACVAVNDIILPTRSTASTKLHPVVGDKVTLVNIALGSQAKSLAQDELEAAAREIIQCMQTPAGEYTETLFLKSTVNKVDLERLPSDYVFKVNDAMVVDDVTYRCTAQTSYPPYTPLIQNGRLLHQTVNGRKSTMVSSKTLNADWERFDDVVEMIEIGSASPFTGHGPIVTGLNLNLDTDVAEVTVGSWSRKTRTGGMADKIETVTVSANASTTGGEAYSNGIITGGASTTSDKQNTIALTQVKPDTLFTAYLNKVMDTVKCFYDGKPEQTTDIFFRMYAFYGTTDVNNSCQFMLKFSNLSVFYGTAATIEGTPNAVVSNTTYELSHGSWVRIRFASGVKMNDTIDIAVQVQHPRHGDRDLTFTVTANRPGAPGDEPMQAFKRNNSKTVYPTPIPDGADLKGWSPTAPDYSESNPHLWMTQTTKHTLSDGTVTYDAWSTPIRMSGDPGADAPDREWIYITSDVYPFNLTQPKDILRGKISGEGEWIPKADQYTVDDYVPEGWSDRAQPATENVKYVYAAYRDKDSGIDELWGDFTNAFLWSNWGVQGLDGDGVQYIYKLYPVKLTDAQLTSFIPTGPTVKNDAGEWLPVTKATADTYNSKQWTDDAENLTRDYPFCYCSVVKELGGEWQKDAQGHVIYNKLALWSTYTESSIRIDLDNQADLVSIDSEGKVRFDRDVTVGVCIFDGATMATSNVSHSMTAAGLKIGDRTPTISPSSGYTGGKLTITWAFKKGDAVSPTTLPLTLSYTKNGVATPYTQNFSLGTTQREAIYQVLPIPSEVSFAFNSSTYTLTPSSIDLYCGYTKSTGSGTITISAPRASKIDNTDYLYYRYKNSNGVWGSWEAYTDKISVPNNTTYLDYEFCISSASAKANVSDENIIDREVVPIVKDGKDGKNSIRLDLDNEMDSIQYQGNGVTKVTSSAQVQTRVSLFDGTDDKSSDVTFYVDTDNTTIDSANYSLSGRLLTVTALHKTGASGYKARDGYVTVYCNYSDVVYKAKFSVMALVNQDKYDLDVNPNALFLNKSEGWSSSKTVTVKVMRTPAGGGTPAAINPEDYGLALSSTHGVLSLYDTTNNQFTLTVTQQNATDYNDTVLTLYKDGDTTKVYDRETIPFNKAENGTSPWIADLDNEMDSVSCKLDGKPQAQTTVSTNISMFYGSTKKNFKITSITKNGSSSMGTDVMVTPSTPTSYAYSQTVTVQYGTNATINGKDDFAITLEPQDATSETRILHFTINGVRPGTDGKPATIFSLLPGVSSISCDKDNVLSPSSFTCSVLKKTGDSAPSTATSSDGTLRYRIDGDITSSSQGTALTIGGTINDYTNSNQYITLAFFVGTTLMDKERIPIVFDGIDGEDGDDSVVYDIECADVVKPSDSALTDISIKRSIGSDIQTKTFFEANKTVAEGGWNVTLIASVSGSGSANVDVRNSQVVISNFTKATVLSLTLKIGTTIVAAKTVRAVADGEPGGTGDAGHVGRWYYYDGEWDSTKTYSFEATKAPYVSINGSYYMLDFAADPDTQQSSETATTTKDPASYHDGNPWSVMQSEFKYIITEAIFGSYAHFGSFIINGDWMISTHGVVYDPSGGDHTIDDNHSYSGYTTANAYTLFSASYPNTSRPGYINFCPNFAVDGKTGATYQNAAYVKGQIVATSGDISGSMSVTGTMSVTGNLYVGNTSDNDYIRMYRLDIGDNKYGSIIESFKGSTRLYRLGYNDEFVRQAGLNHDAALTFGGVSNGTFIGKNHIRVIKGTSAFGSFSIGNGYFCIYSNCWPTASDVSTGEVYKDGTYLRVKQ